MVYFPRFDQRLIPQAELDIIHRHEHVQHHLLEILTLVGERVIGRQKSGGFRADTPGVQSFRKFFGLGERDVAFLVPAREMLQHALVH